ncbi:MAG: hypothetical protein H7832_00825 [Magnetococcus sp. DMHC-6]
MSTSISLFSNPRRVDLIFFIASFFIFLMFAINAWAFFIFIILLSYYSVAEILKDRRLSEKNFLGKIDPEINKRDQIIILYTMITIACFAYILACQFFNIFLFALFVITLSIIFKDNLANKTAQRNFFYKTSFIVGFCYSFLSILIDRKDIFDSFLNILVEIFDLQKNVCGLAKVFAAFNELSTSIIDLLPFPFDILLVPLNLNLLYGPLVAVGVLGVIKSREAVLCSLLGRNPHDHLV